MNPYDDELVTPPKGGDLLFPEMYSPLTGRDLEMAFRRSIYGDCDPGEKEKPLSQCLAFLCFYIYGGEDIPNGIHRSTDGAIYWSLHEENSLGKDRVHCWDHAPHWVGWGNIDRNGVEAELRLSAHAAEVDAWEQGILHLFPEITQKLASIEAAEFQSLQMQQLAAAAPQKMSDVVERQRQHFFPEVFGVLQPKE